eukprot:CAMPEP_0117859592 /NCGR_PEP_ID=MMETSP0950-20121206/3237_1 /TAXON_ID=44440 /ORGANISM="Chattonella subsalsa, Strain CCMP2191" /LENGTH=152 /DNA_ID=CAMNT_0005709519 /DNA_START=148 /DNA_END=606 /DNA_ORIENTATION=+
MWAPIRMWGRLFRGFASLLQKKASNLTQMIGVYYDDPKEKKPSELRCEVGAVVDDSEESIQKIEQKLIDLPGLEVKILPEMKGEAVWFPFKGIISIMIGVNRVYNFLGKHCGQNWTSQPSIELYDHGEKKMLFFIPMENHESMVPFEDLKTK